MTICSKLRTPLAPADFSSALGFGGGGAAAALGTSRVGDGLFEVEQVMVLSVLLNVVVVNIIVDGCHLGDQVISSPVEELLKANPAVR